MLANMDTLARLTIYVSTNALDPLLFSSCVTSNFRHNLI